MQDSSYLLSDGNNTTSVAYTPSRCNILKCLIRELEIFFERNMVLDFGEDQRQCEDETSSEKTPAGSEQVHVWNFVAVEAPDNGRAGGLLEIY